MRKSLGDLDLVFEKIKSTHQAIEALPVAMEGRPLGY